MFKLVKGFKKEDLIFLAEQLGETAAPTASLVVLKDLILNCKAYKDDPEFVQTVLENAVSERKEKEKLAIQSKEKAAALNMEKAKLEIQAKEKAEALNMELQAKEKTEALNMELQAKIEGEKLKLAHELELAKLQSAVNSQGGALNPIIDSYAMRRKFTLPKLEFRKFGGEIIDWLPFWCQFRQIDEDTEIAPEDKFQYLVQATVAGSRAREVVESFPPSGANYAKAIESLKTRFGREDILVEVYVRELLKLIISVQTKGKFSLTSLYDKLESYLRALDTLGVTTDKCASILYPLVESCFPAEFLKAWNRTNISSEKTEAQDRFNSLMQFLRTEVEGEERVSLAVAGFGLAKSEDRKYVSKKNHINFEHKTGKTSTAAGLLTTSSVTEKKGVCVFCQGRHASSECFSARKLNLAEIQKIAKEKRCCFICLVPEHTAKRCRAILKCIICNKRHVPLLCDQRKSSGKDTQEGAEEKSKREEVNMTNISKKSAKVFLQTLKVKLVSESKQKIVRLLLDSASQKSYILKSVAEEMNYKPIRQEKIIHSLFGDITTQECQHNCYKIRVRDLNEEFRCNFEVRDQVSICGDIQPVTQGPWLQELKENGIMLSDVSQCCGSIEVLIGADVMGKMLTGKRKVLSSGLVAVETYLGWTLMGKAPCEKPCSSENLAMTVTSMFVKEADISNLWRLDLIGITDPIEKKSREEIDRQTKEYFLETVKVNDEKRYEICLPWADDITTLPNNFNLAMKRLEGTTSKLIAKNMFQQYENVFNDWRNEGIIEEVPSCETKSYGNYLPHHPVIKENSATTPIRPVFDASARVTNHPSLNQCLQCGPNLIELIPDVLLRFRERKLGVIADIRKAFLQISICEKDRNFLRFLWWKDLKEKKLMTFRHTRVVFGVKCSPFLLSSVIEYHIRRDPDFSESFKDRLLRSFYVDNVVTSVNSEEELKHFIEDARMLMAKGSFDLRQWEYTGDRQEAPNTNETNVLGLVWNKESDMLKINLSWLQDFDTEKITKRSMLSAVHKIFDPFGFTSPVMICPKIMLQRAWKLGFKWDEEITGELRKEFLLWFQELTVLKDIEIPRYMKMTPGNIEACALHTFVDGSKDAYATVIFLRIEIGSQIELVFIASKSRVAPLKNVTIPRMELLAATMGTRLAQTIVDALGWEKMKRYYWSDSSTVLAWISRDVNWSVFVRNRVLEIRRLSSPSSWMYVPSDKNPADLPTRGCKARQLAARRWWEGPDWLRDSAEFEKYTNSSDQDYDEDEIRKERIKSVSMITNSDVKQDGWYYRYFSSYVKIIRMVAWILRFRHNCRSTEVKREGDLTSSEFKEAELKTLRMIQKEAFFPENDNRLRTLQTWKDEQDIIRLETKITYRKDSEDFLKPIVLPAKHEVVKRLIYHVHVKHCHAGLQILLNLLREKYWILNGRRNVKQVLAQCVVCKRFSGKSLWRDSAPLPENRIKDANVFQITGVDMAGPLYLKKIEKAWILIFSCAIYRAVHLELVTAASTEAFLMGLRRFVARRGRCTVIYSDNGTNFTGSANLLKSLDWSRIQKYSSVNAIDWKFNRPTAAWWGGFWERLIRIMKDLLKRVLGHAYLTYEEMNTILTDVESVINARPLTYLSEDATLKPISPSMFLQSIEECDLPDLDIVEQNSLSKRLKYRQSLQKELKDRFRSEYLGALIERARNKHQEQIIAVGDVVLIGSDNKKRIDWPLGRITELIPGRDKKVRLVRVQTSQHELLRPIQRIYPLEIASSTDCPKPKISRNPVKTLNKATILDVSSSKESPRHSRAGRILKIPERLNL